MANQAPPSREVARQTVARATKKAKDAKSQLQAERKSVISADKDFARSCSSKSAPRQPHLEWISGEFAPSRPAPAPSLAVKATVMQAAHEKLGIKLKGSRKGVHDARVIQTIADTGCQTCTAGPELLEELRCPDD